MKNDEFPVETVVAAIIFVGALVIGIFIGLSSKWTLKQEAIERGFAHYNPTNGEWQWKTNVYLVPPGRFIEVLPLHAERP